jgi:FAD/FMN-containing dehydrogenase
MAKHLFTRRELLRQGAIAGAALSVPFIHHRYAIAAGGIDPATTKAFGSNLKGRLIVPGDAGYDAARRVWNWRYERHPAMIAQCANSDDVRRSVEFARKQNLRAAIRSGGHSFAGYSTCDGGLVIDLSQMKQVRIDSAKRVARAEPGILIADFDNTVAPSGLAASLGACPDVGIGGLTLGGGNGWLESVYGTACDNLVSVDLVTADGELGRANAAERPDLYWAMRGAGANFGVATALEYKLHPVTTIMFGSLEYQPSQVRDVLRFLRDYAPHVPDQLVLAADVPGQFGKSGLELTIAYVGDPKNGAPIIKELRDATKPASGAIQPTPYKDTVGTEAPPGGPFASYRRAGFFPTIADPVIDAVSESVAARPSKWSKLTFFFAHGARCRVAPTATAYSLRQVGFECWIQAYWTGAAAAAKSIEWVNKFWERTGALANGRVYVNYLEDEGGERVRAAYGPNYDRLVTLKNKYDPTNFFSLNQNIKPAV